ncbi:hypothetical protein M422DRAFT_252254 [Sphaerobolus stellatus SS14]|uniref:Uncharacterized protein n=1 Tax=Sphaerobolus stellatus (strain SS14) TaxID=990650 RepID=A0A0C9VPU5_SPHS4|nr:hypothetical protein M422DRAFT_252254 [Sphaerobolus stellatus SS14]
MFTSRASRVSRDSTSRSSHGIKRIRETPEARELKKKDELTKITKYAQLTDENLRRVRPSTARSMPFGVYLSYIRKGSMILLQKVLN